MTNPDAPEVYALPIDAQLATFLDQHREMLLALLDGLTEEEARRALVPSRTTLLGLLKHAAFAETVWFGEGVRGLSRAELGIPATPDESFVLTPDDTIASVLAGYRATIQRSRDAVAGLDLDDVVTGNRRGPLPLRWILLHLLRELAQHCGHGEILREQILAVRGDRA